MNINFINGSFSNEDAAELISQLIDVKIKFHENKINQTQNEEDVKLREKRIIQLQNELRNLKEELKNISEKVFIKADILISLNGLKSPI